MFLIALEGVFAPAALYDKSSASFRCQPVVAEIERFSYFFTFCCHGGGGCLLFVVRTGRKPEQRKNDLLLGVRLSFILGARLVSGAGNEQIRVKSST